MNANERRFRMQCPRLTELIIKCNQKIIKSLKYKRIVKKRFHVTWSPRKENIDFDARSDGMFPLITNCEDLSLVEILDKYKYQPWLEKRHEQLKTVYKIAPVLLKSVTRIEGLLFVFFLAMR